MKNNRLNKAIGCVYRLSVHIVFVTKYRRKVITKEILDDLEKIFSRLCAAKKCQLVSFNKEHLEKFYHQKPVLWTGAYCIISTGGAPLEIIKQYIESQDAPS